MSLKGKLSEGAKKAGKAGVGLIAAGSFALGLPQEAKSQEFQENSIENTLEYDGSGDKFRLGINYGLRSNNLPMGYTGLPSQAYHDVNVSAKYGVDKKNSVGLMYGSQLTKNINSNGKETNPNFGVVKANYKREISDEEEFIGGLGYYRSSENDMGHNEEGEKVIVSPHPVDNHLSISGQYNMEFDNGWDLAFKAGSLFDISGKRDKNTYFTDFGVSKDFEGSNIYTESEIEVGTKGVINGFFGDEGHAGSLYGRYTFENNPFASRDQDLYKWNFFVEAQAPLGVSVGANVRFTND